MKHEKINPPGKKIICGLPRGIHRPPRGNPGTLLLPVITGRLRWGPAIVHMYCSKIIWENTGGIIFGFRLARFSASSTCPRMNIPFHHSHSSHCSCSCGWWFHKLCLTRVCIVFLGSKAGLCALLSFLLFFLLSVLSVVLLRSL